MTVFTNTFATATPVVGMREDLTDTIYKISPTETPFMMAIGRGSASQVAHEWQTVALATAAANAQIEGDEITAATAPITTTRLLNRCQISWKVAVVSGTLDIVNKAGRDSEMAFQVALQGQSLRRDLEFIMSGRQTINAGGIGTARALGAVENWIATNVSTGAGYSGAGAGAAVTDGTQRALTESLVKTVLQAVWTQGGNPTFILTGPFNKQVFSTFTGAATRFDRAEDRRLITTYDVYVSDFGEHRVVPGRFNRDRTVLVIDPTMWSVDYLRGFQTSDLAKTGDATKKLILAEYTLLAGNEASSGKVADLTTS